MKYFSILLVALLIGSFACQSESQSATGARQAPEAQTTSAPAKKQGQAYVKDNVSQANALQVAESLDDFSTLVAAIKAAGVENSVVNAGPLTIFAPLNSAFDKLPKGTLDDLLKPQNKDKLAYILTNHVAPANYPLEQLKKEAKKGRKLYMASGKYLQVEQKGDDVYVGGTKILKTVKVSNGWIHVIDDVLVPES